MKFEFKTKPFAHQQQLFEETRDKQVHALFLEQGTGKSKIIIDSAAYRYMEHGDIQGLCVVAPRNVHRNWVTDELPTHLCDELFEKSGAVVYNTQKAETKKQKALIRQAFDCPGFSTIAFSYEALKTDTGWHTFQYWMRNRPSMLVFDEARRAKSPGSKLGKRLVAASRRAEWKRILDGTPVPNGPFDIYQQIKLLDEDFWRRHDMDSFSAFKQHFGVYRKLNGHYNPQTGEDLEVPVGYRRLEELYEILQEISSRRLKSEVLDLPDKLYSRRYFDMTPKQIEVYRNLRDNHEHEWEDGRLTEAELTIVRNMRLHQVTRGYVPVARGEPAIEIDGGNPCQELLNSIVEDVPHQGIIWCRFTKDVELTLAHLKERAVRFDGKVNDIDLERNKRRFKAGEVQWIVGNADVGGSGHTLNEAKTVIYHSNDYDWDKRRQSEDRCHRIGQDDRVHYIDLIARLPDGETTVDDDIRANLLKKQGHSDIILGDPVKEWL